MKRYIALLIMVVLAFTLTGCLETEGVPKETKLQSLNPLNGNTLKKEHDVEGMKLVTSYNTGDYNLSRWRITDSKVINMSANIQNAPKDTVVLVEHVHVDMSLKSDNPQLDGLLQDSMDDSYHGNSQDGFFINNKYEYENKFACEGLSKDLINGWDFVCNEYGTASISKERLTEKNLKKYGEVYANKMQIVYDLLIKHEGEDYFHVVSVLDEFLIPAEVDSSQM